jgi:hypothetical protein|tara:strand:+ start:98 stop:952 length:855 start_codon:yes stop_codon:yes gene_type:complete
MKIKICFLFFTVLFSNTNLYTQEGEYISIENFIYRHQQFTVNQNSIIVPPVDRFINNRISFFIEEKFKDVVKSTRNVIWESYQSKINTLFRSQKLVFSIRVQLNKTNELRYLEVDYLPSSDEISTPYIWDKKSRSFILKNEVIVGEKYNPDLQSLKIDNQDQKAKINDMIVEHKSFLAGMSNNTVYYNKSKETELKEIYKKITSFSKNQYSNIDFLMNISWDSYNTFVSAYDTYHYHTFVVQVKVKNINRNKFLEVYYNPVYDRVTSDFIWNDASQQYSRIALE